MKLFKVLFVLLFIFSFVSCITEKKRAKICSTCPTTSFVRDSIIEKERIVRRDSLIKTPADSSFYKLWLACDKNGKIIVNKEVNRQGARSRSSYELKDNVLNSKCVVDSAAVALQWNETHKTVVSTNNTQSVQRVEVPVKLKWHQKLFLVAGKFFLGFIIIGLGIFAFRMAFKFF